MFNIHQSNLMLNNATSNNYNKTQTINARRTNTPTILLNSNRIEDLDFNLTLNRGNSQNLGKLSICGSFEEPNYQRPPPRGILITPNHHNENQPSGRGFNLPIE